MSDGFDHDALLTAVAELDTEDMLGHLRNFPDDLAAQWSVDEPQRETPPHLFCLGMGGSAAAGDFLASLLHRTTWQGLRCTLHCLCFAHLRQDTSQPPPCNSRLDPCVEIPE